MGIAEQRDALESVLVQVAVAVQRASDAAHELERTHSGAHLVAALNRAADEANATWRRLWEAQFARPASTRQLAFEPDEPAPAPGGGPLPAASGPPHTLGQVNEEHMAQVELVLFELSGARKRAARVAQTLSKEGADAHLVEAVEQVERELEATIDAFFKSTYFHVPKDQLALS